MNKLKRLALVLPLSDLALKEDEKKTRPPFGVEWIKTKLLAKGAWTASIQRPGASFWDGQHRLQALGRGGPDCTPDQA